jgi:hypothetical protein
MRYVIVDEAGLAVNACEWDGETPWVPPERHQAILSEEAPIGATWSGEKWIVPEPEASPVPILTEPKSV